jgi:hypothetical protein
MGDGHAGGPTGARGGTGRQGFDAGTKAGTELSDSQTPSEALNPHENTEPDLSA